MRGWDELFDLLRYIICLFLFVQFAAEQQCIVAVNLEIKHGSTWRPLAETQQTEDKEGRTRF